MRKMTEAKLTHPTQIWVAYLLTFELFTVRSVLCCCSVTIASTMSRPDSCATCSRMVFRHAVTCDGPCGLTFHLTCTSLQLDVEPSFFDELSWVCDGCRLMLQLPPEVWTKIFALLDAPELLEIRLTCRTWKQLVDESPALRRRIKARIAGEIALNQKYDPGVIPCAAGAVINVSSVVSVNSWWPTFGEKLVYLDLGGCSVVLATFLEMLRQVPQLKELKLTDVRQHDEVLNTDVDFMLDNLEKLALSSSYEYREPMFSVVLLKMMAKICPRLKYLAVHGIPNRKALIGMVKAVQTTLRGFKFDSTNMVLLSLAKLEQLELRRVEILRTINYNRDCFSQFFRIQPNIVHLSICQNALQVFQGQFGYLSNLISMLSQFLTDKEFTRLKLVSLKIVLHETSTLNIGLMPTLKNLEVTEYSHDRPTTRFGTCRAPNLQEFRLFGVRIVGNSLTNFLASCPHLQLLHLVQINTDVSMNLGTLSHAFNAMKTLKIEQSNVPRQLLLDMFRLCPNLEDLELALVCEVDDEVVQRLCQLLKRLKRLALECWLHDAAAYRIMEHHGPELRLLEFHNLWALQEETKHRLLEHFGQWGVVRFGWKRRGKYQQDLMEF